MEAEELIKVDNVSKVYSLPSGRLLAIQDITFTVGPGETVAVLGASGCGKSTLLRLMAGLEQPTFGEVFFHGIPVRSPAAGLGLMFQEPRLFPWLTVRENVALGLPENLPKNEVTRKVDALLEMTYLEEFASAYPCQLSGGMAQRAALARVLATDPEVLFLDEPLSGLDIANRLYLQDVLLEIQRTENLSICLVTHDIDEAVYLADRILILTNRPGRIKDSISVPLPHPRNRLDGSLDPYRTRLLTCLVE